MKLFQKAENRFERDIDILRILKDLKNLKILSHEYTTGNK